MKNIATSKSGVEYFIYDRDEEAGIARGFAVRNGKRFGAVRNLKIANLTFVGTATLNGNDVVMTVAPTRFAFTMEMPALNGDVVTQAHADYCAEHGHAKHTNDGVVSPWCPRCGGSIKPAEDQPATDAAPAVHAEPVFEVTSYAPDQVKTVPAPIVTALEAIHADLMTDGSIVDQFRADRAPRFNVHLRAAGEGVAAFWTDGNGNDWRIEFADADRNVTELFAYEWQDRVYEFGCPVVDADGEKVGGRWHTASTMTRRVRLAVERAGL